MPEIFSGFKTYFFAICIIVVALLKVAGKIDESTFQVLVTLLLGGGLITMRSAVKKLEM